MRTVLIEAETMTYSVYEGTQMLASYECDRLLNPAEVEALRTMKELPEVA